MRFISPFTFFTLQTNLSTETDLIESFSIRTWPKSFTINKLFLTNPMHGSVGHFNWNVMLFRHIPHHRCQSFSSVHFNSRFENWKQTKKYQKIAAFVRFIRVSRISSFYNRNYLESFLSTLINVAIKEIEVVIIKMICLPGIIFKY